MSWGYLGEFWNSITEVVVNSSTYTIAWFQSIGNAVAGAVGALFEDLIHHIYDLFYIAQYLVDNLGTLFGVIFTPLTWVFNFVRGFFVSAFGTPVAPEITWTFSTDIIAVFQKFPYWNVLTYSIGAGLGILVLVFIFKRLTAI
jgi:hypothetical protein